MGVEAIAAVAAAAAGTGAAVTVGTVLTAVAWVGTYVTIAGVVTGNKDLVKIGGVMGLVGGVGGLAAGAAGAAGNVAIDGTGIAAGSTADAAGGAYASQAVNQGAGAAVADTAGTQTLAVADPSAGISGAPLDATGPAANPGAAPGADPSLPTAQANSGILDQSATLTPDEQAAMKEVQSVTSGNAGTDTALGKAANTTNQIGSNLTVNTPAGPAGASMPKVPGSDVVNAGNDLASNLPPQMGGTIQPSDSYLGSLGQFVKDNKELVNTATTLVGSSLTGLQKAKQAQQEMDYRNRLLANGSAVPAFRFNGILGGK